MENMEFRPRKVVLVFWLIGVFLSSWAIGGILAAVCSESKFSPLLGGVLGGGVVWFLISSCVSLYFFSIKYLLDDRYITKSSGVIWKKRRSIPLEKITNIDVRQGPFERIFGFGQIWIFTPSTGATAPEEKLIGVSNPNEMKEVIVNRSEGSRDDKSVASSNIAGADMNNDCALEDIKNSLLRIEELLKNLSLSA